MSRLSRPALVFSSGMRSWRHSHWMFQLYYPYVRLAQWDVSIILDWRFRLSLKKGYRGFGFALFGIGLGYVWFGKCGVSGLGELP